jgi:hypothetical protein
MLHITLYQAPCIFQRQRRSRPNALAFQRLVPALNLAVRLWIIAEPSQGTSLRTDRLSHFGRRMSLFLQTLVQFSAYCPVSRSIAENM